MLVFAVSISLLFSNNSIFAQTPSATEAVSDIIAIPGNGEIHLSWTASDDNGSPISSYKIIQWKTGPDSFTIIQKYDTVPNAIITGLANNASYNFKVSAINSEGTGKESVTVSVIPKSPGAPKLIIPNWVKAMLDGHMDFDIFSQEFLT